MRRMIVVEAFTCASTQVGYEQASVASVEDARVELVGSAPFSKLIMYSDLRPRTYASMELFLDMLHAVRGLVDLDFESIAIYVCVGEATMRPLLADPNLVAKLASDPVAPDELRGSITMLLVADRLGLPRETVRRKVKNLISLGLLYEDEKGRIRSTPVFDNPKMAETMKAIQDAVHRYHERLAKYGIQD